MTMPVRSVRVRAGIVETQSIVTKSFRLRSLAAAATQDSGFCAGGSGNRLPEPR
jgi:hypothetical protein